MKVSECKVLLQSIVILKIMWFSYVYVVLVGLYGFFYVLEIRFVNFVSC